MLAICVAFNSVCNSSFINPTDFNSPKLSWSYLFSLWHFCRNFLYLSGYYQL